MLACTGINKDIALIIYFVVQSYIHGGVQLQVLGIGRNSIVYSNALAQYLSGVEIRGFVYYAIKGSGYGSLASGKGAISSHDSGKGAISSHDTAVNGQGTVVAGDGGFVISSNIVSPTEITADNYVLSRNLCTGEIYGAVSAVGAIDAQGCLATVGSNRASYSEIASGNQGSIAASGFYSLVTRYRQLIAGIESYRGTGYTVSYSKIVLIGNTDAAVGGFQLLVRYLVLLSSASTQAQGCVVLQLNVARGGAVEALNGIGFTAGLEASSIVQIYTVSSKLIAAGIGGLVQLQTLGCNSGIGCNCCIV